MKPAWLPAALLALAALSAPLRAEDPSRPDSMNGKASDPERRKTIAGLVANLKDEDEGVRQQAAESLGDLKPPAVEAVAPLIAALEDKAYNVRHRAVESLEKIGTWRAMRAAKRFRKKQKRSSAW